MTQLVPESFTLQQAPVKRIDDDVMRRQCVVTFCTKKYKMPNVDGAKVEGTTQQMSVVLETILKGVRFHDANAPEEDRPLENQMCSASLRNSSAIIDPPAVANMSPQMPPSALRQEYSPQMHLNDDTNSQFTSAIHPSQFLCSSSDVTSLPSTSAQLSPVASNNASVTSPWLKSRRLRENFLKQQPPAVSQDARCGDDVIEVVDDLERMLRLRDENSRFLRECQSTTDNPDEHCGLLPIDPEVQPSAHAYDVTDNRTSEQVFDDDIRFHCDESVVSSDEYGRCDLRQEEGDVIVEEDSSNDEDENWT